VRYPARRKNRRALFGDGLLVANRPFVFAFENLERLVFTVMDVPRPWMRMNMGMPRMFTDLPPSLGT
jgi:hypothetical protein